MYRGFSNSGMKIEMMLFIHYEAVRECELFMKYTYSFEEILIGNTHKTIAIKLPEEIALVEIFLGSDIQGREASGKWVLEYIDKVLNGESEYEDFTGNACYVEVRKDKTKIEYMFTNNETEESCEIETSELRELIEIWLTEREAFYKKK